MPVKASLRGYRISASKARLVVDQIRGKGVENALNILDQSDKRFAHLFLIGARFGLDCNGYHGVREVDCLKNDRLRLIA